ncbi:hypothetical protein M422DRAFT_275542, partial [Sphaerobolus stellatus SS14]
EDEVVFLDSVREKQMEEERERKEREGEELKAFREAVAARENELSKPPPVEPPKAKSPPTAVKGKPAVAIKRDRDKLKGIVVKKKKATVSKDAPKQPEGKVDSSREDSDQPNAKRRKVEEDSSPS